MTRILEVTDDLLGLFPKGTTLTLSRIQQEPSRGTVVKREEFEGRVRSSSRREQPLDLPLAVQKPAGMFVWISTESAEFPLRCELSDTISGLKYKVESRTGMLASSYRLYFDGCSLYESRTLSESSIQRESILDLLPVRIGGKPVIYLFPPSPIPNATVSISLVPQWSFSHVYPLVGSKPLGNGHRCIAWSVSAQQDGTITEKETNLKLSYLFWEAEFNPSFPLSPTLTPTDARTEHFDPAYPVLDSNSLTAVLNPFAELLPYLDATLKSLSLHTSARNDFITYWLPKLAKKPFVALRFLPQATYARATELNVTLKPDVVTRVFMLFRGLAADEALSATWEPARVRAANVDWVGVVGVRKEAWDEALFRVLEWGAMEVL